MGGPSWLLPLVSVVLGGALAAGLAWGAIEVRSPADPTVVFVIFLAAGWPALAALVWIVLLDRDTLAGALTRPEDSIESQWLDRASAAAFFDLVIVAGFVLAVLAFFDVELSGVNVLMAVLLGAMSDATLRYVVLRRIEG